MLKELIVNFLLIFCIVFACIFFFGCFSYFLDGNIIMLIVCGLGLAITAATAVTISGNFDKFL